MEIDRMYELIERPVVTEKTRYLATQQGKYTFAVSLRANKTEVKEAVETIYGVKVTKVNTLIMPAKISRRWGRTPTIQEPMWKKAIVTLAPGDSIPLFEGG